MPHLMNLPLCVLHIISLIFISINAVQAENMGALRSSAVKQIQQQSKTRQLPKQAQPDVTLILEERGERVIERTTKNAGVSINYHANSKYQVKVSADKVESFLNSLPQSVLARLPYPHKADTIISQGVTLTGAEDMQSLSYDGSGVKVGVIDMGFAGLSASQAANELPAGLNIMDYTCTGAGGTDHGTNVAEIVHDMAPAADLFLAKINTLLELEAAMNDMIAEGVRVINHSVGWFGVAFYDGTGTVCEITGSADNAGVIWVNSAGNSRQNHYLGLFTDTDNNLRHEFSSGQNYNTFSLSAGRTYSLVLNWDAYPTTSIDYNLFVYDGDPEAGGTLVASSTNAQSAPGPFQFPYPYESINFQALSTGMYYIVVSKENSGTPNLPLTLFSLDKSLVTRTTSSSLSQPADCTSVLTVAASNLNDSPEYFSSEGPTTDGRNKPDVSGPDRVVTSRTTSFTGTSASSPHVAGSIAQLKQQNPLMTHSEIKNLLAITSQDIHTASFDYRTGHGRISLDADTDSFNHDEDNCLLTYNPSQLDTDLDLAGNACDLDDDNDGLSDVFEATIGTDALLIDSDGDTLTDYEEVAYDGDDTDYSTTSDLNPLSVDTDGDSFLDTTDPIPITFNFNNGDLAPVGAPDGIVNVADYAIAVQLALGTKGISNIALAHGDLYPPDAPDGMIETPDLILILKLIQ